MKTRNRASHHDPLRTLVLCAALLFAVLLAASCTTATYGDEFVVDPKSPDQYSFKIYVGGLQFAPPESEAASRIKEFMAGKDYSSYEILERQYVPFPSHYEFTVRFSK